MRTRMPKLRREGGATMVEYAILMAFVGALLIGSITLFRGALETLFATTAAIF